MYQNWFLIFFDRLLPYPFWIIFWKMKFLPNKRLLTLLTLDTFKIQIQIALPKMVVYHLRANYPSSGTIGLKYFLRVFLDGIRTEFWVFLDFAYAFLTEVDFRNSYFLFVVFHSRAHKNSKVYIQPAVSFVLKLSLRGNHKPHGTVFDPLHPFI